MTLDGTSNHNMDEMVRDGVIEDYVVGGATTLLYFSIPNFITEDIDVFVYLKAQPSSTIADVRPLYDYLMSRKSASIQGKDIVVDGFPIRFLIPYDELRREVFASAIRITAEGVSFKVFNLEYGMAIMIQPEKKSTSNACGHLSGMVCLMRPRLMGQAGL